MQNQTNQYRDYFSNKLNNLIENENWAYAKMLLEEEIRKQPEEYFLITSLSKIYFNMREYNKALKYSTKAINIESNDPLVIYDHGCALSANNKHKEAIYYCKQIVKMDINKVAYGKFGEGMKWAKSIVNDSIFRIAISFIKLDKPIIAKKYIKEHLRNRRRGQYSDFSQDYILETLNKI